MGDSAKPWRQCVYVIAHKRDGNPVAPVKVGLTDQPFKRLATLQTGSSQPLIGVFGLVFGSREVASEVERFFHKYNSAFCTNGEWFDIDPATAIHLLVNIVQARCEAQGVDPVLVEGFLERCGARTRAADTIRRLKGWNFQP